MTTKGLSHLPQNRVSKDRNSLSMVLCRKLSLVQFVSSGGNNSLVHIQLSVVLFLFELVAVEAVLLGNS